MTYFFKSTRYLLVNEIFKINSTILCLCNFIILIFVRPFPFYFLFYIYNIFYGIERGSRSPEIEFLVDISRLYLFRKPELILLLFSFLKSFVLFVLFEYNAPVYTNIIVYTAETNL